MTLVDSSIIIDFLNTNRHKIELEKLILNKKFATTEIIIMEVLQGIKDEEKYLKVKNFMESLNIINATYADYILSANIYRQCRKNGKTIRKSIDCLIASISINNNLKLFSNDRDFNSISECFEFKIL
ncbi:MAG: PIN domain nuclease [Campylobacterales bacterium]|nr:PIN domain nuclease [Campylobacterales bacterium]